MINFKAFALTAIVALTGFAATPAKAVDVNQVVQRMNVHARPSARAGHVSIFGQNQFVGEYSCETKAMVNNRGVHVDYDQFATRAYQDGQPIEFVNAIFNAGYYACN